MWYNTSEKSGGYFYMDKIAIVGIGGAGVNVVELFAQKTQGKYYCVAMDTSTNAFGIVKHFSKKLQLGPKTCEGLGAVEYEKGRAAAVESEKDITELFKGFERIIFVSGLSGGCGGGAGPEIAKIANMLKIKTTYLAFCISSKIPQIIALEPDKKSLVVFEEIKQYADQAIPIFQTIFYLGNQRRVNFVYFYHFISRALKALLIVMTSTLSFFSERYAQNLSNSCASKYQSSLL